MTELKLATVLKRGSRGKSVRVVQEWLSLHGLHVAIDGDFGPATEHAVRDFQRKKRLPRGGVVNASTFAQLVWPMARAMRPIDPGRRSLGRLVVAYARRHLREHPREIGGQNRGPWVRLYMNGHEGSRWAWCAGFVSFVLKQACRAAGAPLPIRTSFSCDVLATSAKAKGLFLPESGIDDPRRIPAGSIFLNRRTSTDWVHTGVVVRAGDEVFRTIEGNTNDEGSREGYEVCARVRGYRKKDFIEMR